jgi:hypothetical protein
MSSHESNLRFVVVVHEIEGVIAEDAFIGPYRDEARAARKAAAIERASRGLLMARVEPIERRTIAARDVVRLWGQRLVDSAAEAE